MEWATERAEQGKIKIPAVLGAVLQLSYCCDLLDSKFIGLISDNFEAMREEYLHTGKVLPENADLKKDANKDKLLRMRDCAILEYMHISILELTVKISLQNIIVNIRSLIQQEVCLLRVALPLKVREWPKRVTLKFVFAI